MTSKNEINVFKFNEMMNNSQIIFTKSNKKFFVDVRKKGNLVLFHMIKFNCTECNKECDSGNMSLILDIIETKLNQKLLIQSKRIIESQCETDYYFIFLTK